jgi:hypothetical protein
MKINYISPMDETFASFRYRMQIPGEALRVRGHEVEFSKYLRSATDSVVFSKHFNYGELDVAIACRQLGQRVIFDVCDNHFETEHKAHYKAMIELADTVTASTEAMADIIKEETGREAVVIPDPYEYPEREPHKPGEPLKLLWYGHPSNLDSLIKHWGDIKGELALIVTGAEADRVLKIPFTVWSPEAMQAAFDDADCVFIPSIDSPRKVVKSTNRMVEAIRQGKFVIANPIPAYEQFKDWMWIGDIKEGIAWVKNHRDEIPSRIAAAQAYVRDVYDPENIAQLWEEVLRGETCYRCDLIKKGEAVKPAAAYKDKTLCTECMWGKAAGE